MTETQLFIILIGVLLLVPVAVVSVWLDIYLLEQRKKKTTQRHAAEEKESEHLNAN